MLAHIWIGNGATQEKAFSTYDAQTPQLFTVDEEMLSAFFIAGPRGSEGRLAGSRWPPPPRPPSARPATPSSASATRTPWSRSSTVIGRIEDGPEGKEQDAPSWVPALQGDEEAPTGLDFAGTPKPTDEPPVGRT